MEGKTKTTTCLFLGLLAATLLAQPDLARSKSPDNAKQSTAAKPASKPEASKVILVLQTREHRITVLSSAEKDLRYSVATLQGVTLADGLTAANLKSRFPELHDIVTGTAWAGVHPRRKE